ncbi:MAG: hypothetical protein WCH34_08510 [Bacteroidota bacterium]
MNKWVKIILILFLVGIVAALLVYKFYINKPHPDYEKLPADFKLQTEVLYNEYVKDKKAADTKYNGKVVELSGKVSKIETSDTLVMITFVFKQGDFGDEGIRCTMLPKYNEETKKIASGADVKIKGFCSGYNDTDVIIEKGSLVKE